MVSRTYTGKLKDTPISISLLTFRDGDFEETASFVLDKEYDEMYHFKHFMKRENTTVEEFERDYLCGGG